MDYFNPHSHAGSDKPIKHILQQMFISIHTPTQGVTVNSQLYNNVLQIFQSTLPRREWQQMGDTTTQHKEISIHTPTQGVTLYGYVFSKKYNDFNPHSHAGSDHFGTTTDGERGYISIHTPTQGVTDFAIDVAEQVSISIHTPTQGVTLKWRTCLVLHRYFNPHSHAGSDW